MAISNFYHFYFSFDSSNRVPFLPILPKSLHESSCPLFCVWMDRLLKDQHCVQCYAHWSLAFQGRQCYHLVWINWPSRLFFVAFQLSFLLLFASRSIQQFTFPFLQGYQNLIQFFLYFLGRWFVSLFSCLIFYEGFPIVLACFHWYQVNRHLFVWRIRLSICCRFSV